MLLRTLSGIAILLALAASSQAQTEIASRFLPNKEYSITLSKALSGNDGYRDVVPSSNTQRYVIRTGALDGSSFPVEMTVFTPLQSGISAQTERVDWDITFTASQEGEISDVEIKSSTESMQQSLAKSILDRHLGDLLFAPVYKLELGRNAGKAMVERAVRRDGTGELYDVTYVVDLPELKETGAPMAQQAGGHGVFDAQLGFFTELVKKEMSKIFVYEDAKGEENHIVMHKDTSVITVIRDVNP